MSRPTADPSGADLVLENLIVLVCSDRRAEDLDPAWLDALRTRLTLPPCALGDVHPKLPAVGRSRSDLAGALKQVATRHPDSAVLVLKAGLRLPEPLSVLRQLVELEDAPPRIVFPGNSDAALNPFGEWPADVAIESPGRLVYWCGDSAWRSLPAGQHACVLFSKSAAREGAAEGPLALIDQAFVADPRLPVRTAGNEPSNVAGLLRLRLRHLAQSDPERVAAAEPGRPVTLHIAHSWGGGVWRWIEDFIFGDASGVNLVLVADSDRGGEICGRGLKLYLGGCDTGLIREFPLEPEIASSVDRHPGYARVLDEIGRRFGVGRIVVSSLIGHSLDCLRTGLPTLQVLHDFYPLWPLLDMDPLPFVDAQGGVDRATALQRHGDHLRLRPSEAPFWDRLAAQWQAAVAEHEIVLTAPTKHVIERWRALSGDPKLKVERIPHAFRPFPGSVEVEPPDPSGRLHLLIPGRLTPGKGLELLKTAIPRLRGRVRITALGCGREAFGLFGTAGIDLIPNYRHDDFPTRVGQLRPHAALFLSTVPETWNYALSEARAVGLAPIATRIGSFVERIRDGHDGLLFDPEPGALVALIDRLAEDPARLEKLQPESPADLTPEALVGRFDARVAVQHRASSGPRPIHQGQLDRDALAARLASLESIREELEKKLSALRQDLEARTRWARKLERRFGEREHWIGLLQTDLERARDALRGLQAEFESRTEWAKSLEQELADTREIGDQLRQELDDRTEWAKSLERELAENRQVGDQLRQQLDERTEWAISLDRELNGLRQAYDALQIEFDERTAWALELEQSKSNLEVALTQSSEALDGERQRVEALLAEQQQLQQQFDDIIRSRSWRVTRPMRVAARLARGLIQRGVLNPLRWPRLIGRLGHYVGRYGARRTLIMLQHDRHDQAASPPPPAQPPPDSGQIAEPIAWQVPDEPEVSVIVPVFNQLHFTGSCLQSLVEVGADLRFEIIVVDDASSDGTAEWLKRCEGIRAIHNRRNRGFIGSCNRGAKSARGRWLVFLNNDTRVTEGWLDALIATFHDHPDTGVAGGRLVFADGTLQEAGGIVFRDGSGWNYGRGEPPDAPDYRFVSEADYVSGACLAIERELFRALGGFDRHYAPAYYEDTDLCFKVREHGRKVRVQPAATVIHYEGGTSGTDESTGIKHNQVVNREKFQARWAAVLAQHPENPGRYSIELARKFRFRRYSRRALVIDATTPMPDHDSGSVRMFALLKLLLDEGFQTRFLPENRAWAGRHSEALQQAGIEVLVAPWAQDLETWLAGHGQALDLVIVSRHYILQPMLAMLRRHCSNARIVFDTVDLHFLREQREAELSGRAALAEVAQKTRERELALVAESDATLVVSEFEQKLLADLVPGANVHVLSNIHSLADPGKPFEQRRDLVFVGGFQHPPNIDAAEWLIDEIMPSVRERLPNVRLHLIGSRMPERVRHKHAPGVRIHGFVADLTPYLAGCRISLAPLRYGAGVKGKVNQAMSHGLPVVATRCAAEGMYAEHEHDILLADTSAEFAAQIVRLYDDPELWRRLAENGRRNVQQHFSVDAARQALRELLKTDASHRRDVGD